MGNLASPRKPRHHPAIRASKHAFSEAIHTRDAEACARIVFSTTLEVLGTEGLLNALDRGNRYWIRSHRND